jgi:type IV secretion system protein VirB1
MAIDEAAAATVPAIVAAIGHASLVSSPASDEAPHARADAGTTPLAAATPQTVPPAAEMANASVFVPEVRGPNDPPGAASASAATRTPTTGANTDQADLRREQHDAAFVF